MVDCPKCGGLVRQSDGYEDLECSECDERFFIKSGFDIARTLFFEWKDSRWDQLKGQGFNIPCVAEFESGVRSVRNVIVDEKGVRMYKDEDYEKPVAGFKAERFSRDAKSVVEDREKYKNRNLDELFGDYRKHPDHVCRVCGVPVDDGRKSYCSDYCRENAYRFQKLYLWDSVREKVIQRDGGCVSCGLDKEKAEPGELHVDHIVALKDGGSMFDPSNLQCLCRDCHIDKGRMNGDFA